MGISKRLAIKKRSIILLLILIFLPCINAEISTQVNISNIPPVLLKPIPNQTWQVNYTLPDAFNLDDYFEDTSGLLLTYTYTPVTNITIIIDPQNSVSFYPDPEFMGIRTLTFSASDGTFTTISNKVYLNVGTDSEPPKWSSPIRSKATVRQNDFINLSTFWTDNVQLKNYIFSIDQGGGWVEFPYINFTGVSNISIYRVQISAPAGGSVSWKFCANDTSENINCTSVQIINISSASAAPETPPPQGSGGGGGGSSGGSSSSQGQATSTASTTQNKNLNNFTVDPLYFRVSIKQGGTDTRVLKISNTGNSNLLISISALGLENFLLFNKKTINISVGGSEKITIDFNAKKDTSPEEYFGKIILNSGNSQMAVPVVLDVTANEPNLGINVNISKKYKSVLAGEIIKANISLTNLNSLGSETLTLYTAIKDISGNIYDSYQEKLQVSSISSFERNFTLPLDIQQGDYIFYGRVTRDNLSNIDSDLFEVGQKFRLQAFFRSSFIFLFIIFLSGISLFLIIGYKRSKDKEKILNLYLMLNELKELIKNEKIDKAIDLYIRIKSMYGEPVYKTSIDKNKLKEEIKILSKKLNSQIEESGSNIEDISNQIKEVKDTKEDTEVKKVSENNSEKKESEVLKKDGVEKE